MAFLGGGGLLAKLVSTPVIIGGALVGAGGVTAVTHSMPTLLKNNGLACETVTGWVDSDHWSEIKRNATVRWEDGMVTKLPWEGGTLGLEKNAYSCYKR